MDIAEFLLARIAEDEAAVREGLEPDTFDAEPTYYSSFGAHRDDWGLWTFNVPPARVLAECEAKRRIIEYVTGPEAPRGWEVAETGGEVLRLLALPYADHPDYRPEWSPLARA